MAKKKEGVCITFVDEQGRQSTFTEVRGRTRVSMFKEEGRDTVRVESIIDRQEDDEGDSCRNLRVDVKLGLVDPLLWPSCLSVTGYVEEVLVLPTGKVWKDDQGRDRYCPPSIDTWKPRIATVLVWIDR